MTVAHPMTDAHPWLARLERFESVESTNDVVRSWLEQGQLGVCVAVADEQTAGRGRNGRTWTAPRDAALLCSVGFRPRSLAASRLWQLAAIVSLAMADAVEAVSGAPAGTVRLKWPNDLVVVQGDAVRKLAGVLGETVGAGTDDPRVVVGIGVNAGWERADFPPDLAESMTSVAELAPSAAALAPSYAGDTHRRGRATLGELREALFAAFLDRLRPRVTDIDSHRFPAGEWRDRQLTNGLVVRLDQLDGTTETVVAEDVDTETGALLVRELDAQAGSGATGHEGLRSVVVGEIRHLRVHSTREQV